MRKSLLLLVFLIAGVFLIPQPGSAKSPEKVKIRLGVGSTIAYSPIYVAKEKGFYDNEGLDVEFVWAQSAPEVIQGIIGGSLEGGVGASFGVIAGISKGVPVTTVAIYAYGGDRMALGVRKDAGIKTLKDLYGKKVAFQSGSMGQQMFITMSSVEGLDTSKIEAVYLENVNMPAALASKSVDAIVTWEPLPSQLEAKGLISVIKRGSKYLQGVGCVVFGTSYIKNNRDVVLRFVKAHFRAAQFARQNPRETSVINSKYLKQVDAGPEVMAKIFSYMVFDPRVTQRTFHDLEEDTKFMLSLKKIETTVNPTRLATTEFSDEIARQFPALVKDLR